MRLTANENPYFKLAQKDATLGWRTRPNIKQDKKVGVLVGKKVGLEVQVSYETGKEGFRPYGDLSTSRKKLFVLGDSYTQAVEVDNDKTYAHHLAELLDMELWCYGQAGYGTYQQYLFLSEYIDEIKPDLILLQMCGNDFIDNYAPLEMKSLYKVGEARPYLHLDGTSSFERPVPSWQQLVDKSKFLALLRKKLQTSLTKEESAQFHINKDGRGYALYDTSYKITELALSKIERLCHEKDIPIVVMVAGFSPPYIEDLASICAKYNIPCMTKPARFVRLKEWGKEPVRTADKYHWAELGHRYIAERLKDTLSTFIYPEITQ